jgi:hypothetical protein
VTIHTGHPHIKATCVYFNGAGAPQPAPVPSSDDVGRITWAPRIERNARDLCDNYGMTRIEALHAAINLELLLRKEGM